jgi:hypothetical protein
MQNVKREVVKKAELVKVPASTDNTTNITDLGTTLGTSVQTSVESQTVEKIDS